MNLKARSPQVYQRHAHLPTWPTRYADFARLTAGETRS